MPTAPGATSTSSSSGDGTWCRPWSRRSRATRGTSRARWRASSRRDREATQAGSLTQRGESERGLSSAVGRLFALAEAYPELKASQNFQELQKSLVDIENNVQYARRYYNAVVRDLNTLVQSFPSNLLAAAMGFGERTYFQLDAAERAVPRVDFENRAGAGAETSTPAGSSPGQPG